MNIIRIFIFILLLGIISNSQAQTNSINEWKEKLSTNKREDTVKLKSLLAISARYLNRQVDSALKYATLSKNLASKLKVRKFELEAYDYLGQALAGKGRFKEALSIFQAEEKMAITAAERSQTIRNQGNIYIELGRTTDAINTYERSLVIANESKDPLTIALTLANIAYVHRQQGNYETAINYLIKATKMAEQINHRSLMAGSYIQLALIQYGRKLYRDALSYAEQALSLYAQLDNKQGKATAYTIIGGSYSELNQNGSAAKMILEAYLINRSLGDKRQISSSAQNLAEIELKNQNYPEALKYVNEAIMGLKEINVIINLISSYVTRAKINIATKNLGQADQDIKEALALSRKGGYKAQEKKALEAYAWLRAAQGVHPDAFDLMVKANTLNDSLLNEVNAKQINELKTKYETEKKQQQIEILNEKNRFQELSIFNQNLTLDKQSLKLKNQELEISNKDLKIANNENEIKQKSLETKQQKQKIESLKQISLIQDLKLKQRNILLASALAVLLFGIIMSYLILKQRKLHAKSQLQEEINKQQDLAARAVLDAEERERRRIAGDLHDGVGQMLSAALMNLNGLFQRIKLENENKNLANQSLALVNDCYDEMRSISHQMMPNALIKAGLASAVKEFLNKINKDILQINLETVGLQNRLDEQTETVLYRVIQETVNNVIKHAEANKLNITIVKDEEGVTASVEDNGKGFDKSKMNLKDGIGIANIYSRVEFLKGTIDYDTAPGRGTLVVIYLPFDPSRFKQGS